MITMDDIVRDGHPVLRQTAEAVELPPTEEEKQQLADMIEFVKTVRMLTLLKNTD